MRQTRNLVYGFTVTWVRIPPSPPVLTSQQVPGRSLTSQFLQVIRRILVRGRPSPYLETAHLVDGRHVGVEPRQTQRWFRCEGACGRCGQATQFASIGASFKRLCCMWAASGHVITAEGQQQHGPRMSSLFFEKSIAARALEFVILTAARSGEVLRRGSQLLRHLALVRLKWPLLLGKGRRRMSQRLPAHDFCRRCGSRRWPVMQARLSALVLSIPYVVPRTRLALTYDIHTHRPDVRGCPIIDARTPSSSR